MIDSRWMRTAATLAAALTLLAACGDDDDSPASSGDAATSDATASVTSPADGDVVAGRFTVAMAAEGITIAPAGAEVDGEGHFHLMIDTPCVEPGEVIPADDQHRHFGGGQTEAALDLDPGEHTICLQVGDGLHTALPVTDEITVTVDGSLPVATLGLPDEATSPLAVTMAVENFTVAPAGDVVEGEGHFHVMVDVPCVTPGEVIPADDDHLHFGGGQTEAELELTSGDHTLCLQLGDGLHTALDITHVVTVTIP